MCFGSIWEKMDYYYKNFKIYSFITWTFQSCINYYLPHFWSPAIQLNAIDLWSMQYSRLVGYVTEMHSKKVSKSLRTTVIQTSENENDMCTESQLNFRWHEPITLTMALRKQKSVNLKINIGIFGSFVLLNVWKIIVKSYSFSVK